MTELDDLPFYDYDPDPREQATAASKARIKEGFTELIAAMEGRLQADREAERQRRRQRTIRFAAEIGRRDGHFIPEGCSIPVSPELAEKLGTKPPQSGFPPAPT